MRADEAATPFLAGHPALQDHDVAYESSELPNQVLEVILTLGEHNRRAAFLHDRDHVVDDSFISGAVVRESVVKLLDGRAIAVHSKSGLSHDEPVIERPARGLAFRIHAKSHGTQLHLSDRMASVAPLGRRGESDEIARFDLRQDSLE